MKANRRWRAWLLGALFTGLVCACPSAARGQVAAVWAAGDGEKIERDDLQSPLKARNSTWDGRTIKLFGGRNEMVAFQVIVEAGRKGIGNLRASLAQLANGTAENAVIRYAPPAADPSLYAGRPIQIFSENYMEVRDPSHAGWVYWPNTDSLPRDPTGWKPVQLVPENARTGKGGFPLRVEAGRNQAIWIEIYTGRGRPAGIYKGKLRVEADGRKREVPVELELFNFDLPDQNSLDAMVYFERSQPELYQGRNLDPQYHRFAHRHRIEFVHAYSPESVERNLARFDGTAFTPARGYEGPGESTGTRIVPLTFYGPGRDFDERASAWKKSDEWMTFLDERLPGRRTFIYMPDEPARSQFGRILAIADNIHGNPGPGRRLPTFVTHGYNSELVGAVDIWCSGPVQYDIAKMAEERGKGRGSCWYNGGRPNGPAIVIESPATDSRAVAWASFKHGIDLYFYWHGVHWRHNGQKQGERVQNVWVNPITFDNRGQPNKRDHGWINGDGVLLYPGEEKLHPEEDRGIPGPISTIQLANLRRGLQDHLYLTIARKLGLDSAVDEALARLVPRVFSEADKTVGFAQTGDEYEAARYKLAQAIVHAGKK